MTWLKDFGNGFIRGFPIGWNGAKSVIDHVPGVNVISKEIPRLHKGGMVKKTANVRLRGGELVLTKGQQTRLKKAKTVATKNRVIAQVSKMKPKPTAAMKRATAARRRK